MQNGFLLRGIESVEVQRHDLQLHEFPTLSNYKLNLSLTDLISQVLFVNRQLDSSEKSKGAPHDTEHPN